MPGRGNCRGISSHLIIVINGSDVLVVVAYDEGGSSNADHPLAL